MGDDALRGRRILIVEDELVVAWLVEDMLAFYGCRIAGPAGRVDDALAALDSGPVDGVLLDINLHGEMSFAVADALIERGVPFVFTTGYQRSSLPARYRGFPLLQKPYEQLELRDALAAALAVQAPTDGRR